jgi:ABC-type antimicrobial peptide transport system permease subunit
MMQGLAGGLIGSLGGALLARWVSHTVFGVDAQIPMLLGPLVVLVAVGVALAGAALPLRRALGFSPAAILREGV